MYAAYGTRTFQYLLAHSKLTMLMSDLDLSGSSQASSAEEMMMQTDNQPDIFNMDTIYGTPSILNIKKVVINIILPKGSPRFVSKKLGHYKGVLPS